MANWKLVESLPPAVEKAVQLLSSEDDVGFARGQLITLSKIHRSDLDK